MWSSSSRSLLQTLARPSCCRFGPRNQPRVQRNGCTHQRCRGSVRVGNRSVSCRLHNSLMGVPPRIIAAFLCTSRAGEAAGSVRKFLAVLVPRRVKNRESMSFRFPPPPTPSIAFIREFDPAIKERHDESAERRCPWMFIVRNQAWHGRA